MDVNKIEKIASPSSQDVNETETVSTSSSGPVDKKSENVQYLEPASVVIQSNKNGEAKSGLDLQLGGSESNTMKDESLTSASELVTKNADKITEVPVLPMVNEDVKEFISELQNVTSAGTAESVKENKNDNEQVVLEPSESNDHEYIPESSVVQLQGRVFNEKPAPLEEKEETEKLPSKNEQESDGLLTNNKKQNSEENIPESSVTIHGLVEAALKKRWDECELLLKKHLVLGCPEIKQLQYCKLYDDAIDKAVEKGFLDLIKLLMHNGFSCDRLLLYSVKHSKKDLMNLMLQKGADVNCKGNNGETPLLLCAEKCSYEVMQLLISNGADVNCKGSEGETPLLLCAEKCSYEVMQLLISNGADVNCKGSKGETPLLLSVKECSCEVLQQLLSKGADINAKNSNNESVLHIAAEHGNYDVVKFLLDDINDGNTSEKIRNDINETNIYGQSALHLSIEENHYNVAVLLLDRGADIDLKDNDGYTPLHICCKHEDSSHLKIFTLLYERHANINAANKGKETPLMLAAKHGNTLIAKCLLNDPYCNIEAESKGYWNMYEGVHCKTAKDYALYYENDDIVKLIETRLSLQ